MQVNKFERVTPQKSSNGNLALRSLVPKKGLKIQRARCFTELSSVVASASAKLSFVKLSSVVASAKLSWAVASLASVHQREVG